MSSYTLVAVRTGEQRRDEPATIADESSSDDRITAAAGTDPKAGLPLRYGMVP
ncbi:MAG: hypothetical protein Q4B08_00325 [Propionibacteriaceae bacterium]|nr:hypothetical protein [Propionibacteriaceae bacterium]